jgi:hypothetical protein
VNSIRTLAPATGAVGVAGTLTDPRQRLTPITCGGPFLPEDGSYRDNLVVAADPAA